MIIQRDELGYLGKPTLGHFVGKDNGFTCVSLERPCDDPEHPCLPAGVYTCYRDMHHPNQSGSYEVWELDTSHMNPPRSQIQIHVLNRADQSEGCIGPGENFSADRRAIEHSKDAFDRLMHYTRDAKTLILEIRDPK